MGGLDNFLAAGGEDEEAEAAPQAEHEPEQPQAPSPPEPAPAPEPEAEEVEAADGHIPAQVLAKARQDWKERAIRFEEAEKASKAAAETARAEAAELRRQLEEARRPPPPPPPQYRPPQEPDPAAFEGNPAGYVSALIRYQGEQNAAAMRQQQLSFSRLRLADKIGEDGVRSLVEEWGKVMREEPALNLMLDQQDDPFGWAHRQIETRRLQREIGGDPAAFRAKVEAELRAKLQAEAASSFQPQQAARAAPQAPTQPSLARGRSVAAREIVDDTDTPFNVLFAR